VSPGPEKASAKRPQAPVVVPACWPQSTVALARWETVPAQEQAQPWAVQRWGWESVKPRGTQPQVTTWLRRQPGA